MLEHFDIALGREARLAILLPVDAGTCAAARSAGGLGTIRSVGRLSCTTPAPLSI
jgi:hypothetical protein